MPPKSEYYYDPFGRRLWKDVDGVRIYFLYSNEGLIGEYDSSGSEIKTYGYAPNSLWTTNPLFQKTEGVYYWYQNNHLGTPQKLISTSGRAVWSAVYDSFGNVQIGAEEITNNLRFPGHYYDGETGLHYNLNRYYDPNTGRYLKTDPFRAGLNLYAYVFNNPLSWIDPLGLCGQSLWGYWNERYHGYYEEAREDIPTTLLDGVLIPIPPGALGPVIGGYTTLIQAYDYFIDITSASTDASRDTIVEGMTRGYWEYVQTLMGIEQGLQNYYWSGGGYR